MANATTATTSTASSAAGRVTIAIKDAYRRARRSLYKREKEEKFLETKLVESSDDAGAAVMAPIYFAAAIDIAHGSSAICRLAA